MAVRFAYDIKTDVDGEISRFKARLVARGDLSKDGIDHFEDELFAPTMVTSSICEGAAGESCPGGVGCESIRRLHGVSAREPP